MRIVAGSHKGHRIVAPKGTATRPTGDRVREAAFALIGPVDDAVVLDLYAGSGAMGLEALSRGARRCVFVESDRAACRVIQANLAHLRLTGALVLARDAVSFLREQSRGDKRYDLILADPPYGEWRRLEELLAELLVPTLAPEGLLLVETEARTEPTLPLDLVTSRRYGSARLTLFQHG